MVCCIKFIAHNKLLRLLASLRRGKCRKAITTVASEKGIAKNLHAKL